MAAMGKIEAIAALDQRDREVEPRKPHPADAARLFEQRRQNRISYANHINRDTVAAIELLKQRLQGAHEKLGGVANEVEFRGALGDLSDALQAMSASLSLEAKESVKREAAAAKQAA